MTAAEARARGRSIAWPIFLLVLGAVLVATFANFAITFRGPPPHPAPVPIAEIAAALRGTSTAPGDARRLDVSTAATAPSPRSGERPAPARDAAIAAAIGAPQGDVRGYYAQAGPAFPAPAGSPRAATPPPRNEVRGGFTIGWRNGGGWRVVRSAPEPLITSWHVATLGGMLAALLLLAIPAWWIARAISRPLADLARAAGMARPGVALPPAASGPREVRALADALGAMHARLAAHAENRTAMLAAIAHDLGTPLSRIAFWIERLPEPARARAAQDIEEMRAMLGDVLRFARDERVDAAARVDLGSVLDALADDLAAAGQPVTIEPGERVLVRGDAGALRRLFANLVENAIRYGERARIGWSVRDAAVTVRIDDAGPGFDPASAERLFEPFARGDPSRNRATGGTGLGLAIVRSLAEAHGGTVTLGRHDGGGRVTVTLPLA